jgi:hypothetical protein
MIGKPQWFKYRIFGWGLAPKTWQGWLYGAIWFIVIVASSILTTGSASQPWVVGVLIGILILDVIHIMFQMPKVNDERENYHQLIIERNCSFAAIIALICVAIYQAYQNRALMINNGAVPFDISIAIVLGAMLAAKIGSTIYVKMKM